MGLSFYSTGSRIRGVGGCGVREKWGEEKENDERRKN